MKKVLYISSPFSAPTEHEIQVNILEAEKIAIDAIAAGWYILCPHKNSSSLQHLGLPNEFWYQMDLELLSRCDAAIFNSRDMVKSNQSVGMDLEYNYAMDEFIPSIHIEKDRSGNDCYECVRQFTGPCIFKSEQFDHFPTPEEIMEV
jgi:nucleoside 2-deoxyribosyltransferase